MPSRAYTSFLPYDKWLDNGVNVLCQCPLGLIPHFYKKLEGNPFEEANACQCPLGLIPHFYTYDYANDPDGWDMCVNALSGLYLISTRTYAYWTEFTIMRCQCPLGLIPHFYGASATGAERRSL